MSDKITVKELYSRYANGERNFAGINLSDSLIWIDDVEDYDPTKNVLSGINLSGANLIRARLECVNLSGADLSGADLSYVSFGCSDLSSANLSGANLTRTEFTCTNLSSADLRNALNVCVASFDGANLTETNLMNSFSKMTISGNPETLFNATIMPDGEIFSN